MFGIRNPHGKDLVSPNRTLKCLFSCSAWHNIWIKSGRVLLNWSRRNKGRSNPFAMMALRMHQIKCFTLGKNIITPIKIDIKDAAHLFLGLKSYFESKWRDWICHILGCGPFQSVADWVTWWSGYPQGLSVAAFRAWGHGPHYTVKKGSAEGTP